MTKKYRDRIDIFHKILELLKEKEMKISYIAGEAHVAPGRIRKYMNILKENNLVKEEKNIFKITKKGKKAYNEYNEVRKMFGRK